MNAPVTPLRRLLAPLTVLCAVTMLVLNRLLAPRRFVVADRSMEPTLVDGQGLVATLGGQARIGQLRTFEHPERAGFWLVKRVTAVSGESMIVESDNTEIPTVDSKTFGPVSIAGSYRVVLRLPRRWM